MRSRMLSIVQRGLPDLQGANPARVLPLEVSVAADDVSHASRGVLATRICAGVRNMRSWSECGYPLSRQYGSRCWV